MNKSKNLNSKKLVKIVSWVLIIGGIIGLICAYIIIQDKMKLLQNPSYIPSCNLNPVISCGSVMQSPEAAAFGISNPFLGLIGFSVLVTIGVALQAKAVFKKWFWWGLEIGAIFGVLFVHWLFFESVYNIHALCPYCMVVWIITITTFWYVTIYNIEAGNIKIPTNSKYQTIFNFVKRHHIDLLILWLLIIAGLILKHFWYYYSKHL